MNQYIDRHLHHKIFLTSKLTFHHLHQDVPQTPQTERNTLLGSSSFTPLGRCDCNITAFPCIKMRDAKSSAFDLSNISITSLFLSAFSSLSFLGQITIFFLNNTFKNWAVNLKGWNLMNMNMANKSSKLGFPHSNIHFKLSSGLSL